jgi:ankyrin repeat protein
MNKGEGLIVIMGSETSRPKSLNCKLTDAILQDRVDDLDLIVCQHPHLVVKPVNDNLWSPLILACLNGSFEIVKFLVNQCGVDLDYQDYNGFTALIHVVYKNSKTLIQIAEFLCEKGARLELKSNSGITAHSIAISNNSKPFTRLLEFHQQHGYWARHPFSTRKKILWVYKNSGFKKLPLSLIRDICSFM